nr:hypothetical protein [Streptomyces chartreusis]
MAGALTPRLAVEDLRTVYHGTANPFGTGTATVTYTVRNTGNVRLAAHQTVGVRDGLGGTAEPAELRDLPELLPGDSVSVKARVDGVLPAFRDTTSVTIDPQPVRGDIQHRILPRVTRTEAFTAVPWAFLALLLLLATAVTFLLLRRRRRRRTESAPVRSVSRPKQAVGLAAATLLAAAATVGALPRRPARRTRAGSPSPRPRAATPSPSPSPPRRPAPRGPATSSPGSPAPASRAAGRSSSATRRSPRTARSRAPGRASR